MKKNTTIAATISLVCASAVIGFSVVLAQSPSSTGGPNAGTAVFPEWAYPTIPATARVDDSVEMSLPGSSRRFTRTQIENDFAPPDWFPEDHPSMPAVVANGRQPAVKACAKCHVTNGAGHPESSDVLGLPEDYFIRQFAEFKEGHRSGIRANAMVPISKAITDDEIRAAAKYFASLPRLSWTKVVETESVPKSELRTGVARYPIENAGTEPLGNRIIELPQDPERADLRDSRIGFVAYVPVGSTQKGQLLVLQNECASCHGLDLRGLGDAPTLTGRSPTYMFRQMNDMRAGARIGAYAATMRPVVANLSQDEMISIVAYLATLAP